MHSIWQSIFGLKIPKVLTDILSLFFFYASLVFGSILMARSFKSNVAKSLVYMVIGTIVITLITYIFELFDFDSIAIDRIMGLMLLFGPCIIAVTCMDGSFLYRIATLLLVYIFLILNFRCLSR